MTTSSIAARLPHVFPQRELVRMLLPTYVEAVSVDDDEAVDRLGRALADATLREDILRAIGDALAEARGARTGEDAQLDKISQALGKRHRFAPAPGTPALSAVLVGIDLAAGLGEGLGQALATDKGRALYQAGLLSLGRHLVKELSK